MRGQFFPAGEFDVVAWRLVVVFGGCWFCFLWSLVGGVRSCGSLGLFLVGVFCVVLFGVFLVSYFWGLGGLAWFAGFVLFLLFSPFLCFL